MKWLLLWVALACEEDCEVSLLQSHAPHRAEPGAPGTVDGLFTFGAPGSASPGLVNRGRPDGCFPGARVVTQNSTEQGLVTDPVAWITNRVFLWQPRNDLYLLDVEDPSKDRFFKCSDPGVEALPKASPEGKKVGLWSETLETARLMLFGVESEKFLPTRIARLVPLHKRPLYDVVTERSSNAMLRHLSGWAGKISYLRDANEAASVARNHSMRVVGAAIYRTGTSPGLMRFGTQVSYLVQDPKTMDCVLTFQGTKDKVDWTQNVRGITRPFCGLTGPSERCCPWRLPTCWGTCRAEPGNSFVHSGFWAELYRMTRNPSWQSNIRSRLPFCRRVSVFGHSLGGAMADLFTACVTRAPAEGTNGHEDYNFLSWKKQAPKLLEESDSFDV